MAIDNVVIFGAGGFLGVSLFKYLSRFDLEIICISRSFHWDFVPFESSKSKFIVSNLCESANYTHFIHKNSLIIYMAGSTNLAFAEQDPVSDYKTHFDSLFCLFEFLGESNPLIYLSSAGTVYGENLSRKSHESDPLFPLSIYGHRNKMLEEIVSTLASRKNITHVIFRLANPFGQNQFHLKRMGLILSLIKSSFDNQPIHIRGNGLQSRDYFHVDDFSKLIYSIILTGIFPQDLIINIGCGKSYTARSVVSLISEKFSLNPNVIYDDKCLSYDVIDSDIDTHRLKNFLGHLNLSPLTFEPLESSINRLDFSDLYN